MPFTSQTCSVTHNTSSSEFYTQRLRLNKNPDVHDYICHQHRAQSGAETDDDHTWSLQCVSVNGRYDNALSWMSHCRADGMNHSSPLFPLNPTSRRSELLTAPALTTGAFPASQVWGVVEGKGGLLSLGSPSWDLYYCQIQQAPIRKCLRMSSHSQTCTLQRNART